MFFRKLTTNEIIVIEAMIGCLLSIFYLILPRHTDKGIILSYSFLIGSFSFLSGWIIGKDRNNGVLDFLKILFPATISILGSIWLFSSGYLNLRAENLKNDITKFEKDTLNLKTSLRLFQHSKDSILDLKISLEKENDSLIATNKILATNSQKNSTDLERENAKLRYKNEKLSPLLKNIDIPVIALKSIDLTDIRREIKITFYDKNGRILTDKDITVIAHSTWASQYINSENCFLIKFFPPPHEVIPANNFQDEVLKKTKTISIYKVTDRLSPNETTEENLSRSFYKSIKLPFATASYEIILNDFSQQ